MPAQTTKKSYVYFPDGAQVKVKASGDETFTDLGAINSAVNSTLEWTENAVTTANAGDLAIQVRQMLISGEFTLINLNPDGVEKLGGGVFEVVDTEGDAVTASPDQTVSAGWSDNTLYNLLPETSATDSTVLKCASAPTLDSVTLDAGGTPESLVEDDDYVLVADTGSPSGYSIQFISGNMTTGSPTEKAITIAYSSVTPVESTTVYAGASTQTLTAYALQIVHTDADGLERSLSLYSVYANSGGFQFNFKGADEDGVEEMPVSFTAKLDTSRTSGRQLMAWNVDVGAA